MKISPCCQLGHALAGESGRVGARPDQPSLFGQWFAKDDLAVHRDDGEDERKPFAVAVWPSGPDFGPETVIALVDDMPGLEGGRFGFGGGCG